MIFACVVVEEFVVLLRMLRSSRIEFSTIVYVRDCELFKIVAHRYISSKSVQENCLGQLAIKLIFNTPNFRLNFRVYFENGVAMEIRCPELAYRATNGLNNHSKTLTKTAIVLKAKITVTFANFATDREAVKIRFVRSFQ